MVMKDTLTFFSVAGAVKANLGSLGASSMDNENKITRWLRFSGEGWGRKKEERKWNIKSRLAVT